LFFVVLKTFFYQKTNTLMRSVSQFHCVDFSK